MIVRDGTHKRGRAAFLFALEQERDVAGQGAKHRLPGATGLKECHELTLVIARPARADHLAPCGFLNRWIKRVTRPKVQRINGLHVVVTIEQQVPPRALVMAHHHRMARCRARLGVHPEGVQFIDHPIGGAGALGLVCRIG